MVVIAPRHVEQERRCKTCVASGCPTPVMMHPRGKISMWERVSVFAPHLIHSKVIYIYIRCSAYIPNKNSIVHCDVVQ